MARVVAEVSIVTRVVSMMWVLLAGQRDHVVTVAPVLGQRVAHFTAFLS